MTVSANCSCGAGLEADSEEVFPDVFLAHVRAEHKDWPFEDLGVRLVGEAILRLTGPTERLETIGEIEVHPVMPDRLDDWLAYFDHDAFVDKPWVAACYCLEQHGKMAEPALGSWRDNRQSMIDLFRAGKAFGYLAYVDGQPAGWVNAAMRSDQVYGQGRPDDAHTVAVSCFNIAPPYQGHKLSAALLDRVIADAPARGAKVIEAYPRAEGGPPGQGAFRGARRLYESRGFEYLMTLAGLDVVRLQV